MSVVKKQAFIFFCSSLAALPAWSATTQQDSNKHWVCKTSADGKSWVCSGGQPPQADPAFAHWGRSSNTENDDPAPARPAAVCKLPQAPAIKPTPGGKIVIQADRTSGDRQRMTLTGKVDIRQGKQRIQADRVIFDKQGNRISASGNVRYQDPVISISGKTANKQIQGDKATITNSRYRLSKPFGRGAASEIRKLSAGKIRLKNSSYTSCPVPNRDWELKAKEITIDKDKGVGKAKNVTLRVKGVPVLYAPYLSFPVDDRRKSGFLFPSVRNSDKNGFDLAVPYYWNIAPNRDATITPRTISKRGFQLGLEYRYLYRNHKGEAALEYLPSDDLASRDRHLFTFKQEGSWGNFKTYATIENASDAEYFRDLRTGLTISNSSQLEQRADISWSKGNWNALARVLQYQPLIGSAENYRQLPLLRVNGSIPGQNRWLRYFVHAEFVRYDHRDNVVTGDRVDLQPGIEIDIQRPAWFVRPRLSIRSTSYSLQNQGAGNPSSPDRTTPILSIDSGMFFERKTSLFGVASTQTLEPRLYYLYVPHEDQSKFPVFDTTSNTFSFQQLFRENRFSGADRQGDANQVTLALTSRYLRSDNGREWLRASIGQIFYLEDRLVTLPGQAAETASSSDFVSELYYAFSRYMTINLYNQWDTDGGETSKSSILLRYRPAAGHLFNLGYRYERNVLEQADLSFLWRINPRWTGIARWNYSIRDDQTLEGLLGIEYNSCCWGVRLVASQYVNSTDGSKDNTIALQFVLKGLGKLGKNIDSLLSNSILGYSERRP